MNKAGAVFLVAMGIVIGLGMAMLYGASTATTSAAGLALVLAGVGGILIVCGLRRIIRNEQD